MPKTKCFFIHLTVLDAVLNPLLWFFRFFASLRIVDSLFGLVDRALRIVDSQHGIVDRSSRFCLVVLTIVCAIKNYLCANKE